MLTALWCYTNWRMYYLNLSRKLQHIRAFGLPQFFALLDSCYSILLSYDTMFQLGDFYTVS